MDAGRLDAVAEFLDGRQQIVRAVPGPQRETSSAASASGRVGERNS